MWLIRWCNVYGGKYSSKLATMSSKSRAPKWLGFAWFWLLDGHRLSCPAVGLFHEGWSEFSDRMRPEHVHWTLNQFTAETPAQGEVAVEHEQKRKHCYTWLYLQIVYIYLNPDSLEQNPAAYNNYKTLGTSSAIKIQTTLFTNLLKDTHPWLCMGRCKIIFNSVSL